MNRRKFFRTSAAVIGTGAAVPYLSKLQATPALTQEMLNGFVELIMPLDAAYSLNHSDFYGSWKFLTGNLPDRPKNKS